MKTSTNPLIPNAAIHGIMFGFLKPGMLAQMKYESEKRLKQAEDRQNAFFDRASEYLDEVGGKNITCLDSAEYWQV